MDTKVNVLLNKIGMCTKWSDAPSYAQKITAYMNITQLAACLNEVIVASRNKHLLEDNKAYIDCLMTIEDFAKEHLLCYVWMERIR